MTQDASAFAFFADLYAALDATTSTGVKVSTLSAYFRAAAPSDAAWALALLTGRRPKRSVSAARLRSWIGEAAALPGWLVDESHSHIGDLAETAALLASGAEVTDAGLAESMTEVIERRVLALAALPADQQQALVMATWRMLPADACLVYTKLITGGFRVGVAAGLVQRAVAEAASVPVDVIANRLAGTWRPTAASWAELTATIPPERIEEMGVDATAATQVHVSTRPFPFALAHAWDGHDLGDIADWQIEWKWDGIRAQLIHAADGTLRLWSRGDEELAATFPEVVASASALPLGTILDGEVLAWAGDQPLPFARLQKRLGRKRPTAAVISATPCRFLAYDCLAVAGADLRRQPTTERRAALTQLPVAWSPVLTPRDWLAAAALRASAREHLVEGLMLKRRAAPYPRGRVTGEWWKWKADPFTLDAVLLYAQAGHGRRAGLHTDYTLGIWQGDQLVPVAKAYSGLTDVELKEIDRWVRAHTTETFGPVRKVEPLLVFEIAFDGAQASPRHKSGIALRFPRIARWRRDKPAREADTVETVRALL